MTHHPNTPASRSEPVAVLRFERNVPGRENDMPRVVSCNWQPDGEYPVYLAASRTEQAAPSVASGVEKTDPAAYLMTSASGATKWPLMPKDVTPEWRNVCAADGISIQPLYLAAPGAAIAAREQEADPVLASAYERDYLKAIKEAKRWAEMIPEIRGDYSAESVIALLGGLVVASRQEAPAASEDEIHMAWRGALKACGVSDADRDAITEVVRSMLPTPARSPATVAQPVDAGASRKSAKDAAEYEVREWMGENDVVLKSAAYRALITLVLAAQSAAQPCPTQGCGGDGGEDEYFLQDTRSYVGNCPMWWAEGGNGYTSRIDKAQRYSREQAVRMCNSRGSDVPWPCAEILPLQRPTIDVQDLPRSIEEQRAALSGLEHVGKEQSK